MSVTGFLVSQVGYDPRFPIRVMVRGPDGFLSEDATVCVRNNHEQEVHRAQLVKWGDLWGSTWWVAELGALRASGTYHLRVLDRSQPVELTESVDIASDILWNRTVLFTGVNQAERRARLAVNRVGWQDCGASWQEANSHAAYVLGFCELLERSHARLDDAHRRRIFTQIINGCDYLALLQDLALELGLGDGAVSHQKPKFQEISLPGEVAKCQAAWAAAATSIRDYAPDKRSEYLSRAQRAARWLDGARPSATGFSHLNHGAPESFEPPNQWMTRDLLMRLRAAVTLSQSGLPGFQSVAIELADKVLQRQVPREHAQDGIHGHFYTFDSDSSQGLTEKAWTHHINRGMLGCDAGGHYPNDLQPLLRMLELWPDHPHAHRWRSALHNFTYGYLLPACRLSPFLIVPLGYFPGEGWLHFAGLWHGMNAAYAHTAALALDLAQLFRDPALLEIATGNLQWIAGLNSGLTAGSLFASHMFSADIPPGIALSVSQICGIGRRWAGTWLNVRGSICNGFSTGDQFTFDTPATRANDGPHTFTDEDWITHAGCWLSAIARYTPDLTPEPVTHTQPA